MPMEREREMCFPIYASTMNEIYMLTWTHDFLGLSMARVVEPSLESYKGRRFFVECLRFVAQPPLSLSPLSLYLE